MLSIIIPALNEEQYLPDLLECLKKQTFLDFEVIVADASSTDKTALIAKNFGAVVVKGGKPAVGRNNGAKNAKGEIFLFLDSDITFDSTFLERILNDFNSRKLDLATAAVSTEVENKLAKAVYTFGDISDNLRQYTKKPAGTGACILVKREVFFTLKGFREDLILQEDWDFLRRGVKKKYRFRILKAKISVSTRRFDSNNYTSIILGGIIGLLLIAIGLKSSKLLNKLYGGWGNFKKVKKP